MTQGKTRFIYPALIISILLLASCNRDIIYTDSVTIPEKKWLLDFNPEFSAEINDTLNNCDILFTLRNSSSYPFRNIFLFVTTTSPNGASITDTLEYMLADEKGKWFGKGLGELHELTLSYKPNIYFPLKGTYKFKIQHGMRVEDLNGVYDIGLRIVKTKKN